MMFGFMAYAQTTEIIGKVTSTEGEALPGVEVVLSSPNLIGGNQAKITDAQGKFRFFALPPGVYNAEAKLQGFTPKRRTDLRLSQGKTLTVDFVLEVGSLAQEVTIIAKAPTIDLKDSQTGITTLATEVLQKLVARDVQSVLNMTPGVTSLSSFGSAVSNSNKYQLNGVATNDPEAGESALNLEFDSIEEIDVMGVGAPAEYDGYSGAIVNTVMKSGGNQFHGMATFFMQAPSLHSQNWDDYPYLVRKNWPESYEGNFNLGGPIIKDKLWFFTSGRYRYSKDHIQDFTGLTESHDGLLFSGKLTWQANRKDRFSLWAEIEPTHIYNYGTDPLYAPEANTNENHLDYYYNSDNMHVFSGSTFLELKIGGYRKSGHNLVALNGPPAHRDLVTDVLSGNYGTAYNANSNRFQVNVALSHYADDFIKGSHDFKFGVELEQSKVNISYFNPSGKYYLDYNGSNYILDEWGGDQGHTTSRRFSAFVQDSWTIGDRLVINPGLRLNIWRGYVRGVSGAAYAPKTGIAPRIGLTFDVFGDKTTAFKAHYGKYYHGLMAQFYMRLEPQGSTSEFLWGPVYDTVNELPPGTHGNEWVLSWENVWQNEYTVDPNLKMAYMNQFVVGIERQLLKDLTVGVNFISRSDNDLQDRVNLTGQWATTTWTCDLPGPDFGKTYTVYQRLNPGENQYLITNPKAGVDYGTAFPGMVSFTPTRKYTGLEFTLEKRYSNGWMVNASYVYGRARGNNDNAWGEWGSNRGSMLGSSVLFSDPNYQINATGPLSVDPTHQVKVFGAVDIPVILATLGLSYSFTSGNPYNSNLALPLSIAPDSTNSQSYVYIYGEDRGNYRLPATHNIEARLEKYFMLGNIRVGALVDIFNLLNSGTVTQYWTRIRPGSSYPFGYVWNIVGPRTFRLGFRFQF